MTIASAIRFTAPAEGGFTVDNGGPTMFGVTQAVYDSYRKRAGVPPKSVELIDMQELQNVRKLEYWIPAHCDDMTEKMGVAHFDWTFNHGVVGAMKTLQSVAGVQVDGIYGGVTKAAVQAAGDELLQPYLDSRRAWCRNAVAKNPSEYAKDLNGWLNRVDALQNYLKGL